MGPLRERFSESGRAFAAVRANRELRKVQLAFAGSITGEWGYLVALAVYANAHGGATAVSLILVLRWFGAALAGPWLAVFADRYRRQRVMLASDVIRAVSMAAMAVAAYQGGPAWVIFALATWVAIVSRLFRPAQAALLPSLAQTPEELTAANVSSTAIESIGSFLGPALGGLLLAATSTGAVFAADAAALVWSALLVSRIRTPGEPSLRVERGRTWHEVSEGFRVLLAEPDARVISALYCAQTLVAGALRVLLVVAALDLLDIGTSGLGFLNAAIGVGGLVGVAIAFALVGRRRLAGDFGIGLLLIGVGVGLLGVWPTAVAAAVLMGVFGIGNTLVDVSGVTLLQHAVPDEVLGRVFGALQGILVLGLAAGALIAPVLLHVTSIRVSLIVVGGTLTVLAAVLWRRLAVIDARAHVPEEQIELLRANPIFAPLPPATIEGLAMKLVPVTVGATETVFRQGDPGDRFYIVEEGRVEIWMDGERVADEWPGEAFGEIALLRDVPRTATATAAEETKLLALERDDFIAAVTGHAPSREAADSIIGERLPAPIGIEST
jgi:MFS family permease